MATDERKLTMDSLIQRLLAQLDPEDPEAIELMLRELTAKTILLTVLKRLDELDRSPSQCRFADATWDGAAQFTVVQGERPKGIKTLKSCFSGSTIMTICDPYFLILNGKRPADYIKELKKAFPDTLETLVVFYNTHKSTLELLAPLNAFFRKRNISLTCIGTKAIHDRVWSNDSVAYSVGASFNGIGNQCSFILQLPEDDKSRFFAELRKIRKATTAKHSF